MKKLMIVAAVAAMASAAFAEAEQVYDYKLTLKSITCKKGKVTRNTYLDKMGLYSVGDEVYYRTPATITFAGVSWGCDCSTALGTSAWLTSHTAADGVTEVWDGLVFWNTKTGDFLGGAYDATIIGMNVLNRIGAKATQLEMSFDILPNASATSIFILSCAGQGTIKDNIVVDPLLGLTDCNSYIASASGNVAGYLDANDVATGGISGCWSCGTALGCDVWDYCDCDTIPANSLLAVAYGTWTMKYNAAASKKMQSQAAGGKITNAYTGFPKSVKAALVAAKE